MKMAPYLPMLEPLDPTNPQTGHMRRSMDMNDSTDSGVVQRIMYGAQQGFISPEVVNYLLNNLLDSDQSQNAAIRSMSPAPRQPNPMDVVPKGLLNR